MDIGKGKIVQKEVIIDVNNGCSIYTDSSRQELEELKRKYDELTKIVAEKDEKIANQDAKAAEHVQLMKIQLCSREKCIADKEKIIENLLLLLFKNTLAQGKIIAAQAKLGKAIADQTLLSANVENELKSILSLISLELGDDIPEQEPLTPTPEIFSARTSVDNFSPS